MSSKLRRRQICDIDVFKLSNSLCPLPTVLVFGSRVHVIAIINNGCNYFSSAFAIFLCGRLLGCQDIEIWLFYSA
jgi:hypothetical protein